MFVRFYHDRPPCVLEGPKKEGCNSGQSAWILDARDRSDSEGSRYAGRCSPNARIYYYAWGRFREPDTDRGHGDLVALDSVPRQQQCAMGKSLGNEDPSERTSPLPRTTKQQMTDSINNSLGGGSPTASGTPRDVVPTDREAIGGPRADRTHTYNYPWIVGACGICRVRLFTRAKALLDHYKVAHPGFGTNFRCAKCGAVFVKLHSVECHMPKCRGARTPTPEGGHKCNMCERSFPSSRGLATHKRIRHLEERVREREEERNVDPLPPRTGPRATELWSREELEILSTKEKEYAGRKQLNMLIAVHLPHKTNKQVSNKRALQRSSRAVGGDREGVCGETDPPHTDLAAGTSSGSRDDPQEVGTCPTGDEADIRTSSPQEDTSSAVPPLEEGSENERVGEEPDSTPHRAERRPSSLEVSLDLVPPLEEGINLTSRGEEAVSTPLPTDRKSNSATERASVAESTDTGEPPEGGFNPDGCEEGGIGTPSQTSFRNIFIVNPYDSLILDTTSGDVSGQAGSCEVAFNFLTGGSGPSGMRSSTEYGDPTPPFLTVDDSGQAGPLLRDNDQLREIPTTRPHWRRRLLTDAIQLGDSKEPSGIDAILNKLLRDAAEDRPPQQEDINAIVESMTDAFLATGRNNPRPGNKASSGKEKKGKGSRRRQLVHPDRGTRKRIAYAKCQELYKKTPGKLADIALSGFLGDLTWRPADTKPKSEDFSKLYGELWATASTYTESDLGVEAEPPKEMDFRVTPKAVSDRLRKVKRNCAAGPDGIMKQDVTGVRGHATSLAKLFSVLLSTGLFPDQWRRNRTTLIPKAGKDASDPNNYRPITISSLLARLYSGLLDSNLRKVVRNHDRQKGFVQESGCAVNCTILDHVLCAARKGQELTLCQLDISKAFDTIPHGAISPALRRAGVPREVAAAIDEMYKGINTTLGVSGSPVINIKRGVKQGDPLSPLIFNCVMDDLIKELCGGTKGFRIGTEYVPVLAFADDLILLNPGADEAQRQLDTVANFLAKMEMSLSPAKCAATQIVPLRRSWFVKDPKLVLRGEPLKGIKATESFTYLGVDFTPGKGMCNDGYLQKLLEGASGVRSMALKPRQKVAIIFDYLIPRFLYKWGIDQPSRTKLKGLDQDLRILVREILHLHPSTTSSVFYTKIRDGGMGLVRMNTAIIAAGLRIGSAMASSADPVQAAVVATTDFEWHMSKLASQVGATWPLSSLKARRLKDSLKRRELADWAELKSQGRAALQFRGDPVSNRWLKDQKLVGTWEYINAIKLRTDTFGTRVALKRADSDIDSVCRGCRLKPESLGHVLGECVVGKGLRIRRHNEIVDLVETSLIQKGCKVLKEQSFLTPDGQTLKPDLVVTDGDRTRVVDVTIRYESGDWLERAVTEKALKYQQLEGTLALQLGNKDFGVIPLVLGSRGLVPKLTRVGLNNLGIGDPRTILTMVLVPLRTSIKIATAHLDYT